MFRVERVQDKEGFRLYTALQVEEERNEVEKSPGNIIRSVQDVVTELDRLKEKV